MRNVRRSGGVGVAACLSALAVLGPWARADAPQAPAGIPAVPGLRLGDGERVVATLGADGAPVVVSKGAASTDDPILQPPSNDPKVETVQALPVGPVTAKAGQLVFSFRAFGRQGAVLKVENGQDRPMIYDATLWRPHDQQLVAEATTVCPVRGKSVGVESWGGPVAALTVSNLRYPPGGDLRCSGDSGLTTQAVAPSNLCTGASGDPALDVELRVDPATGQRTDAQALWKLRDEADPAAPQMRLSFPMAGRAVAGHPTALAVLAIALLDPPPTSKTAAVVVLADGVEAARRPWKLYAEDRQAALKSGQKGVAFVGVVPFALRDGDGRLDPGLEQLLARIGDGRVRQVEVRVEGDDGVLIGHAAYALTPAPVRDEALFAAALRKAEAEGASPGHCAPKQPAI
jgi:hypothetical protein